MAPSGAGKATWANLRARVVACTSCPRLVEHRGRIARERRAMYRDCTYWGRPVPSFGDTRARLLIVGLAPAAHGANRTGRMFTGDRSGDWLFEALHGTGFASQAAAVHRRDGLRLRDARITAIAHCAPPDNAPSREEVSACRRFLVEEMELLRNVRVVVVLGGMALKGFLDAWIELGRPLGRPRPKFRHGARTELPEGTWLLASYHPSQQNTFTGRLTRRMLRDVFREARRLLAGSTARYVRARGGSVATSGHRRTRAGARRRRATR